MKVSGKWHLPDQLTNIELRKGLFDKVVKNIERFRFNRIFNGEHKFFVHPNNFFLQMKIESLNQENNSKNLSLKST